MRSNHLHTTFSEAFSTACSRRLLNGERCLRHRTNCTKAHACQSCLAIHTPLWPPFLGGWAQDRALGYQCLGGLPRTRWLCTCLPPGAGSFPTQVEDSRLPQMWQTPLPHVFRRLLNAFVCTATRLQCCLALSATLRQPVSTWRHKSPSPRSFLIFSSLPLGPLLYT